MGKYKVNVVRYVIDEESSEHGEYKSQEMIESDWSFTSYKEMLRILFEKFNISNFAEVHWNYIHCFSEFETEDYTTNEEVGYSAFIYGLSEKQIEKIKKYYADKRK